MAGIFYRIVTHITSGLRGGVGIAPAKIRLTLAGGFPYEIFDLQAQSRPWRIINMAEYTFMEGIRKLRYLDMDKVLKDYSIYTVGASLCISNATYDLAVPKHPLVLESELVYVGDNNFRINSKVLARPDLETFEPPIHDGPGSQLVKLAKDDAETKGTELATCSTQTVVVSRKTRQAEKLPQWWRRKFAKFSSPDLQLWITPEKEPSWELVKSCRLRINHSDIDSQLHPNWSTYFKYCLDGIYGAAYADQTENLLGRRLKRMEVLYVKEGFLGEWIEVRFWRSSWSPDAYHCNIVDAKTYDILTYALVEFFPIDYTRKLTLEL